MVLGALLGCHLFSTTENADWQFYSIPEGKAQKTLKMVAVQGKVDLVAMRRITRGVDTPALEGHYEVMEAFGRLLESTPIKVIYQSEINAYTVVPRSPEPSVSETQNEQIDTETIQNMIQIRKLVKQLTQGATALGFAASSPMVYSQDGAEDEVYELSPFEVDAKEETGYRATNTLAGSRIRTDLRDLGSAIQVVTEEFLEDTGSTDINDLLVYTTNTETGGMGGNFSGANTSGNQTLDRGSRTNPSRNTRVRGLNSADLTRDFFLTDIPMDTYNTNRVDIQRGPNSILFGLGSPAGIINNSLKQPGLRGDDFGFSFRFGKWGSTRAKIDVDKTLIEGKLGVRVIGLSEQEKFRQNPAFEEDERFFVSTRWTPDLSEGGSTTIELSYEDGDIDANRPRSTPPKDLISPWFDPDILNKQPFNPLTDTRNGTYHGWQGRWFEGVVGAVFPDHASSVQGGNGLPEYYANGAGGIAQMEGVAQFRLSANNADHIWNVREGRNLAGFWKDPQVSDETIFDFRNHLLDGPNKSEWNYFDALNLTLSQTFLNDKLGFEFVIDDQGSERGDTGIISNAAYGIEIEFNTHLPDGRTNPNYGRPFVASDGVDGGVTFTDRDAQRATVYYELDFNDFMDSDSWLARTLGRHVFTANVASQEIVRESRGTQNFLLGPEIARGGQLDSTINRAKGAAIHYLGDRIDGMSSPSGAYIPGIQAVHTPGSGSALLYDGGWVTTPLTALTQPEDAEHMWDSAEKTREEIESEVLVWQGWLLDSTIVGLFGWRNDNAKAYSKANGTAPRSSFNNLFLPDDPSWVFPDEPSNEVDDDATTWGLVAHSPEFINRNLPGSTKISLSYNESSNFRPSAGRSTVYGAPHAAPSGETKDYGVSISTLDNKLHVRATWYDTVQANESIGVVNSWFAGNIANHFLMFGLQRPTASADIINEYFGLTGVDTGDPLTSALPRRAAWGSGEIFNITEEEQAFRDEWFGARSLEEWFAPLDPELVESWDFRKNPNNPLRFQSTTPAGLTSLSDTVSEGFELETVFNPNENWRISLNASKQKATRSNIGADLDDYIAANVDSFFLDGYDPDNPAVSPETIDGFGDVPMWNNRFSRTVASESLQRVIIPYYSALNQNGVTVQEMRQWRLNLVTNYTFREGGLKGFDIGGGLRWQDEVAIGNPVIEDAEVGLIPDVQNIFMGPSETAYDFWIGYRRKIMNDNGDWQVRLNVRDLFGSDDLIPITAQPNGEIASFRIPNPKVWYITNSFRF